MWLQKEIQLRPFVRGFHLITSKIMSEIPEVSDVNTGLLTIFIKHTSASLSVNENADPTVRQDFESYFSHAVRENEDYYTHTLEGSDDMPAHIKASILGSSVTLPVTKGYLNIGTWQGIYLGEHRNHAGSRKLIITLQGE